MMGKSQEVSNKTLLILIVAVTVVTIVSTWFIVSSAFDARATVGDMQDVAQVSLTIEDSTESVSEPVETDAEASIGIEETAENSEDMEAAAEE
ncbi:hypothetical protein CL619_04755 [archaeon]|nr:hypothetical protein [archaeon]